MNLDVHLEERSKRPCILFIAAKIFLYKTLCNISWIVFPVTDSGVDTSWSSSYFNFDTPHIASNNILWDNFNVLSAYL
jgi:hypothetical protein